MEVNTKEDVKKDLGTICIHLKVRDEFSCRIKDNQGNEVKDYEGYVPSFMPGEHYGDYVILDIDIETGRITNWDTLNIQNKMQTFLEVEEED